MAKLTPEELLRAIDAFPDDPLVDEDMERVLAMTPEEVRAELEADGFSRAELDAKADAFLARRRRFAERNASALAAATTSAEVVPSSAPRPEPTEGGD